MVAVLAVALAPAERDDVVQVVPRVSSGGVVPAPSPRGSGESGIGLVRNRAAAEGDPAPVFATPSWAARPVAAAAVSPPGVPAAPAAAPPALPEGPPPLAFKVLGSLRDEGDRLTLFLQFHDQNLAVRAGDRIAGLYHVEKLDEAAMTVLHLPSNQRQTLGLAAPR